MFTKDNDAILPENDVVRERKTSLLFFHTFDSMTWIHCPKIDKVPYFIIPLPLNVTFIFKESLFDCTCKNADVSTTIVAAKMDLLVELLLAISR